ncbi:MAG TPA: 50S ribosomal protein L25/general stress protein Ctc [Bacillales bacterium]|nr:50S ribosomal protein L25/general stress protein Ctc [Bacillales bacterium]
MAIVLEAQPRDNSKKSTIKKIRREGNVPAVVYGHGVESRSIYFSSSDFIKVIREAGRNGVITLKVDKDDYPVMVHEMQFDNLKDELVHADFYKVDMSSEVDAEVAVHLTGDAAGEKEGGLVQQLLHEISVRALPADIPDVIEMNIEALNIGDSLSIEDLPKAGSYEILNDPEDTVVTVTPPQSEDEPETDEDEEREPELVDGGEEDQEERAEE